jgi:hypothetical protein
MVADCWVFVGVGRFYLQSNTARIMPITLTKNRITYFSGLTSYSRPIRVLFKPLGDGA